MHQPLALLLATLATLGSAALGAQTEAALDVRISETGTCLIGHLDIPCSEVREKVRELQRLPDTHIHVSVDPRASYYAVNAALEGLRKTGLKIGYANVQEQ
jgi:biopolymer transport protein ExbD